jgi:ATP-dependent RNA helicase SUPV3L1/SUV3
MMAQRRNEAASRLLEEAKVRRETIASGSKTGKKQQKVHRDPDIKTSARLDNPKSSSSRHAVFRSTVLHGFNKITQELIQHDSTVGGWGAAELKRQASEFLNVLDKAFSLAEINITDRDRNSLFWNLREAFILKDVDGLTKETQYSFQSYLMQQRTKSSKAIEASHQKLLDFRFPHEWFPATRTRQRTIHVHVGPTNSGKTYNAIQALKNSRRGLYCGPLRLLAHETYQRLIDSGYSCALLTGEEVRYPEDTDTYHTSCTVEMAPLNIEFDVAVIDEIQMLADPIRGHSWTAALLGLQATEIHVCGEDRTVPIIKDMCRSIGDKCIVHTYERLSPLKTAERSLGGVKNLEKGDAIIAFSRVTLHGLRTSVEKATGRRCAIVYGTMPPEVRVQQAALFNDPDNDYDYIVASDAIGMGLNLEIRRVVLESISKFDGATHRNLTIPEIKQIGGRAGRYRTARTEHSDAPEEQKMGVVTTLDTDDLRMVTKAFRTSPKDITKAVVNPPASVVEQFALYHPPGTPLSYLLTRIKALARQGDMYELHIDPQDFQTADLLEEIPLTIYDRLVLLKCPISTSDPKSKFYLVELAKAVASNTDGRMLDIPGLHAEVLDQGVHSFTSTQAYLHALEGLSQRINMYLWLSYRFAGMFRDQGLAFHLRELVQNKLIEALDNLTVTEDVMASQRRTRRMNAMKKADRQKKMGEIGDEALLPLLDQEGGAPRVYEQVSM